MACNPAWSPGLYILVVGLFEEYGFCYVTKSNTNLELKNCIRNEVAATPMSMNRRGKANFVWRLVRKSEERDFIFHNHVLFITFSVYFKNL